MQGVVEFLITTINCKFTKESFSEKIENRLRFDRIMATRLWPRFLAHPVSYVSHLFIDALCMHLAAASILSGNIERL